MFEDFKRAWQQAVDNFWQEVDADSARGDAGRTAMFREVAAARNQLARLDAEVAACADDLADERRQVEVCERRQKMAEAIGDDETARVAAGFGERHRERAAVLAAKLNALRKERSLCRRDLTDMEAAVGRMPSPGTRPELDDLDRHPSEDLFRGMEAAERRRSADERLEELKRRMSGEDRS